VLVAGNDIGSGRSRYLFDPFENFGITEDAIVQIMHIHLVRTSKADFSVAAEKNGWLILVDGLKAARAQ